MSGKNTHKYFVRKVSDWNILEFLKECEEEPFELKIDYYTKSLENIANHERDNCRRERAQALLDKYRKGDQIDYHLARAWDKGRSETQIHYHRPTFMDGTINGVVNGVMTGGTFIAESRRDRNESDDDFLPPKNRSTKRKKQLSLPKKNKGPIESTASKKIKTTSKNVDEKGSDDDLYLSNESSTNSGSSISGSTLQTINSDENGEPVVDSTQDIEATIIDETLETLARESLTRNGEWIICFGKVNVRESLKKWKCEKDRPHNDLGYYDIIDLTPGTNSDFINSLSKSEYEEIKSFDPPKLPDINYDEIKELIVKMVKASDFRKAVNENFLSTRDDESKEFAWDFAYNLANSFDHGNDLLHPNMSERMYREVFITPVIRSLFRKKNTVLDLFFGEVSLYASAEDADLKKNDAEERSSGRKIDVVWATKPPKVEFAIGEISGPPNQRQHSHFFTDKIKIGKMLKIMLNRIVRVYGGNSSIFSLLKLYGLQIYDHNVIVYEMTVPFRELYIFREVVRSQLPTSRVNIVQIRQCIPIFLLFKEMIIKSLNGLHEYIMEAGLHTPPDKIKASPFVTEMTYTPPSKKVGNNKEIGKRGGKSK